MLIKDVLILIKELKIKGLMVDCPHDLVFPDPNISVHDGVEEENLTEHDDTSQAEDSQTYYRAVQSITTENENKDSSFIIIALDQCYNVYRCLHEKAEVKWGRLIRRHLDANYNPLLISIALGLFEVFMMRDGETCTNFHLGKFLNYHSSTIIFT
jgi:hypothetical protein